MNINQSARAKVNTAIMNSVYSWPRLARGIISVKPVEKQGIGQVSMSHDLKLYYDPDVVDSLSVEELSYEIEKGVLHPVLSHSQRGKFLIYDKRSQTAFTHATDLVAHKVMQDSGRPIPELDSKRTFESYTLENDQGSYHLWSGSCTEEIYSQILRGLPEEDSNESPTDNADTLSLIHI